MIDPNDVFFIKILFKSGAYFFDYLADEKAKINQENSYHYIDRHIDSMQSNEENKLSNIISIAKFIYEIKDTSPLEKMMKNENRDKNNDEDTNFPYYVSLLRYQENEEKPLNSYLAIFIEKYKKFYEENQSTKNKPTIRKFFEEWLKINNLLDGIENTKFPDGVPTLTGGINIDLFLDLLGTGNAMFKDLIKDDSHGRWTHAIQMFVIQEAINDGKIKLVDFDNGDRNINIFQFISRIFSNKEINLFDKTIFEVLFDNSAFALPDSFNKRYLEILTSEKHRNNPLLIKEKIYSFFEERDEFIEEINRKKENINKKSGQRYFDFEENKEEDKKTHNDNDDDFKKKYEYAFFKNKDIDLIWSQELTKPLNENTLHIKKEGDEIKYIAYGMQHFDVIKLSDLSQEIQANLADLNSNSAKNTLLQLISDRNHLQSGKKNSFFFHKNASHDERKEEGKNEVPLKKDD